MDNESRADEEKPTTINSFDELQAAAMLLVEYLRKKGHPHMTAIVSERSVRIVEDLVGLPLDYDD